MIIGTLIWLPLGSDKPSIEIEGMLWRLSLLLYSSVRIYFHPGLVHKKNKSKVLERGWGYVQ